MGAHTSAREASENGLRAAGALLRSADDWWKASRAKAPRRPFWATDEPDATGQYIMTEPRAEREGTGLAARRGDCRGIRRWVIYGAQLHRDRTVSDSNQRQFLLICISNIRARLADVQADGFRAIFLRVAGPPVVQFIATRRPSKKQTQANCHVCSLGRALCRYHCRRTAPAVSIGEACTSGGLAAPVARRRARSPRGRQAAGYSGCV